MLDLQPDEIALFLDVDGTLVEIAPRPDAVVVPARLPALLSATARRLDGALAVVSGRPIAEIDRLLAPLRLPAAGLHGLEWRTADGAGDRAPEPAGLASVRAGIAAAPRVPGIRIEDKGLSIALHYRDVPHREAAVRALAAALAEPHAELSVLHGKMVVEVKPAAANKGSAVRRFMASRPFSGRRPVFVGDDVTDEDGMRAALAAGGSAIRIGAGQTVAPERLAGPAALLGWLADLAGTGDGHRWDV